MPWLTQLADVARATGFPVTEVGGWKTRGHGPQPSVEGVVCHHTAGSNDRHVVVNGRPGLEGPLSHIWLQHTGRIWVVAAGRCWHNAPSTSSHHMNSTSIGIEAENDGRSPWPQVQLDAYYALC
ncbi:N-acetylmuramoyl-L-alanine amidase, partial [Nonomuraea rubra]